MSSPTKPPSEEELTQFVIDKLAAVPDREQLVFDVCRLTGWQWDRADLFIKAVEQTHFRRIKLQQSPWLVVIALGTLLIGLLVAGVSAFNLWLVYRKNPFADWATLERVPYDVNMFFAGIVMVVSALVGLWVLAGQVIRGR
ncbi:MAG: hypothetical protein HY741_04915 [Chloroflexi bacterium]|nr:hypothetical protein [Chloroflexota bacterium]